MHLLYRPTTGLWGRPRSSPPRATAEEGADAGEASDDAFGRVASAGDVDGNGFDDLLFGARRNDEGGPEAGKAYLFLTP